ncbi:hypothetical protein WCD74_22115 [Actinomycetospora sp. OC33-EN08]|uniref:5'-nucleotidase n=1 Tax=Actinomycetospora aurantiaca TaxID=3129233 RepID=A0ABU8MV18_9PSEU
MTTQGARPPGTFTPSSSRDGRNIPVDWIKITYDAGNPAPDTDLYAAAAGHVSVTALSVNLTSEASNDLLREAFNGGPAPIPSEEPA